VGARLFDRKGRTVALTVAGALFHEETRSILPQLVRAGDSVRRSASGETARLRLGFVSAVLSPELVEVLRAFRERHPTVQLRVQDNLPAEQLNALAQRTLDGGFVGVQPRARTPGVTFIPWRKEPLAAFVPSGHRLAERREIALRELGGEPLVAVSQDAAPAFSAFVDEICRTAGFRPRIVLESSRAQAVAVMVAAGGGIALLPASLARIVGAAAVVIPLKKIALDRPRLRDLSSRSFLRDAGLHRPFDEPKRGQTENRDNAFLNVCVRGSALRLNRLSREPMPVGSPICNLFASQRFDTDVVRLIIAAICSFSKADFRDGSACKRTSNAVATS